ncbi:unnamed protein product [Orchesella dallaii]|uniref:Uncharacterized protein n=1 Tax=Orchesella dallaii TaxID=48710 RepID=A0ABP1Q2Y2_9HEXA
MKVMFQSFAQRQQALMNLVVQQSDKARSILEDDEVLHIQNGQRQRALRTFKARSRSNVKDRWKESESEPSYLNAKEEEEQLRELEESIKVLHDNTYRNQVDEGRVKVLQRKPWTISQPEYEKETEPVLEEMWDTLETGETDEIEQLLDDNPIFSVSPKLLVIALAISTFSLLFTICTAFRLREIMFNQLYDVLERSVRSFYVFQKLWELPIFKEYVLDSFKKISADNSSSTLPQLPL